MVPITFPVARALNLLKTQDLEPLVKHLGDLRDDALRKLATCNDVNFMFRLQGEVSAYSNFLSLVEQSSELVQKTRNGQTR